MTDGARRTSTQRPPVLVVAERLPRPDESSGSARFLAMLSLLARAGDVDLWVERDETAGRTPLPAARVAADRQRLADLGVRVLAHPFRSLLEALATGQHGMVLFEMYDVAARYLPIVRDRRPSAALVVDSVDVHFARFDAGAAVGAVSSRLARSVRRAEIAVYRAADAVIVVSAEDERILRAEPGMPPLVVVPNCVTLRPRASQPRADEVLFVGHFHHAPNLDGLQWFVRDVWPRVRARHPQAQLTVVGSYASADVHALGRTPGVHVEGYVPDLTPFADRAAVAIAPLRYGAGMKGKVTNAMAAGLPVVTTSIGAQGLDAIHERHLMIADTAEDFADALSALFADPERALAIGLAGQDHVAGICGPDVIKRVLRQLLEEVPRTARARRAEASPVSSPAARLRLAHAATRHRLQTWLRQHARWLASRRPALASAADVTSRQP